MGRAEEIRSSSGNEPVHLGAVALLGSPVPRNPISQVFLAAKAAAACALALALDTVTGNPDHVTSTFVAVLCVSPVVLMGLRRAFEQVVGSLIGGLCGTVPPLLAVAPAAGIPFAVGAGVLLSFFLGFGRGYPVAAFTAILVQAVPRGEPLETLRVRMVAVATAAASAFLANTVVSSVVYRSIFRRRLRFAEATVSQLLAAAAECGPQTVRRGFPLLAELESQLAMARGELRFRRSTETASWLAGVSDRVAVLRRLLHLVLDLSYLLEENGLPPDAAQGWLRWLITSGGEEPRVPATLAATTRRIRRIGRTLRPD